MFFGNFSFNTCSNFVGFAGLETAAAGLFVCATDLTMPIIISITMTTGMGMWYSFEGKTKNTIRE